MDWAMTEKSYSQRRACALAGIDPRVYRRKSKRPTDTEMRARMRELASERRRFGYRRLHILLKREGWEVNWKKLYRLYREEGLTVRKRGGHKRAIGTRAPMAIARPPRVIVLKPAPSQARLMTPASSDKGRATSESTVVRQLARNIVSRMTTKMALSMRC